MEIQNNINLKKYNTFKISSIAKYFCEIKSANDILELIESDVYQENKKYFLGSGANTIFVNDYQWLVIKNNILWKEIISQDDEKVQIRVWAGEAWTDFVVRCANKNLVWMENLAFVPSSVWATAVQNLWAYGVESKDIIKTVEWVNLETKETRILDAKECNFGYRDSIFKNDLKNKFIITHVAYEFKKFNNDYKFNTEYRWISEKISEMWFDENNLKPSEFVEAITEIRKAKLPDREKIWTAGSFFKNPVVSESEWDRLQKEFPELKWFEVEDGVKLSAGQLIDMCGFKWQNDGKVGTYRNHALILVNEWPATGQDVKNFANQIQTKVKETFGIELWPEAIFVE